MTSLPITFPEGYSPIVKVDDSVKIGDILAKKNSKEDAVISLTQAFHIPIKKAGRTLRKNPGDSLKPGDIVAIKRGLFGMSEDRLESKVEGIILKFDRGLGNLVIRLTNGSSTEGSDDDEMQTDIISPIDGKVILCNNGQIVIETDKDVISGTNGVGGSNQGEAIFISTPDETKKDDLLLFALDAKVIGKVVMSPHMTKEALMKSIGMGVIGIVSSNITEDYFSYLIEKKLTIPVIKVTSEDIKRLENWAQKKVFLEGSSKSIILLHA